MLATDVAELLAQVPEPVRFVSPSDDALTPTAYLARACEEREGFELSIVPGKRGLPYAFPVEAVRAIAPDDAEGVSLASHATPAPQTREDDPFYSAAGGIERAMLRAGLLNLIAATVVVVLNPVPGKLLTVGFAAWVAIASLSAIVGAVSMKRRTAGKRFTFTTTALPTLLMGLTGLAVASFLFADPANGRRFFGLMVAVYATARGAADIYIALRVERTGKPRWLLYAGGTLGIATALAIVFGPNHGRGLVRLSLAAYLGLTGVSLVSYVLANRRAAERRVRELLGR